MPIVSSSIVSNRRQIDDRLKIIEQHVDNTGKIYLINYIALSTVNLNTELALHASNLSEILEATEISNNLNEITQSVVDQSLSR